MKKSFNTSFIGITITGTAPEGNVEGYVTFEYRSRYAIGESNFFTKDKISHIVEEIEELCGKGSFCLYEGSKADHANYPKVIDYSKSKDLVFPRITFWQAGIKSDVIEQTRNAMEVAFGDIPETKIGWLEGQCKSYIGDIK